jgi:hypothetical protein
MSLKLSKNVVNNLMMCWNKSISASVLLQFYDQHKIKLHKMEEVKKIKDELMPFKNF